MKLAKITPELLAKIEGESCMRYWKTLDERAKALNEILTRVYPCDIPPGKTIVVKYPKRESE